MVHTHNLLTHNLLTHNLRTHNLLTHNLLTHTHNLHTHNLLTHNLLTHNLFTHNLSTHNLLTHNLHTYNVLTQAWHLATWIVTLRGRRGTYGTGLALVARWVPTCRRGRRGFLRGRRGRHGTWRHVAALCVAGVALWDIHLHLQRKNSCRCCSTASFVTSLHFLAVHLRLVQVCDL